MGLIERALLWLPRRVGRWTSDNPHRVAGGVAAVAALAVTWLSLRGQGGATPAALAEFTLAHPAYPVAVVVGLGVLLFSR